MPDELRSALLDAFAQLQVDQASNPDWHPNTDEKVQDLVHPSMYPLVYGRTRFFEEEVVDVDDAIDKYAGKGDVISGEPAREGKSSQDHRSAPTSTWSCVPEYYWSTTHQWLPSNVSFTDQGAVRFTSYINNLHPIKHRNIYETIEKLIEIALPMWDQCLTKYAQAPIMDLGDMTLGSRAPRNQRTWISHSIVLGKNTECQLTVLVTRTRVSGILHR